MILQRTIEPLIVRLARHYPVITLTGPRQTGKTTLAKTLFPNKPYVSMENLDTRRAAEKDPVGFLKKFPRGAVLDEVQRTPDILSYLQGIVDEKNKSGMFILTGSSQFHLLHTINQSLAGRTALVTLLPFSYREIYGAKHIDLNKVLYTGFYPRIFDKKQNPTQALSYYTTTYLERDVRNLITVKDLSQFELFLKLCAGRTGQVLNLSSLGNECGINHNTARSWISVLEASYIIFLLKPHHNNFNKRLIKSPKLYFLDVGLACSLLNISNASQLDAYPLRGALFETFVVGELLKARYNQGKTNNLYYYRDNIGNEVDVILDYGTYRVPMEIKSGATMRDEYLRSLAYYDRLNAQKIKTMMLVYGGTMSYREGKCLITSYSNVNID